MKLTVWQTVVLGLILYLFLYLIEQYSPLPRYLNWYLTSLIIIIITALNVYIFAPGNPLKKLIISLSTVLGGFILTFLIANLAYVNASNACYQAIIEKYGCSKRADNASCSQIKGDYTEANGMKRSWNQTQTCAAQMMPLPWFKQPKLP